ncbi:hypothetical protein FVA95_23985 [Pseudonocardia sp. EV170527-09]|uniref:B3/B4 domain-containing protein n=1 Tax=Pseudonocardia sp. EV170527-09 TaxID=2603411 RepID=UPI0011F11153|nr:phenylalanine--tRNA ligase beta subunit-related protein [Pseudonocardia sp. EV170527-09]KAA1018278.1 hypothetical protein FVA95_23985 [Pseudonocardia sp. EV170527-09]
MDESIFDSFPGMQIVVATVTEMKNSGNNDASRERLESAWTAAHKLSDEYPNSQSVPRIGLWRTALRDAGINPKKYPVSIEAMVRRAFKTSAPLVINPLTDLIHSVSLDHLVPVGGFDLGRLRGDFRLARTRGEETFRELGTEGDAIQVEAGEIAYLDDEGVQTRQFVWRQAGASLIVEDTTDAVIVAEVLAEVGSDVAEQVSDDLKDRIETVLERPVDTAVLDGRKLSCELPAQ